jgi:GR25 family glycosyltransferase involved in LPS biosynthesis
MSYSRVLSTPETSQAYGFEPTNNTESEFNWYVINLKRRPDRLKLFKERCPLDTSKIKVLTACDGKTLTSYPNSFGISVGEIGCFISHVLCWEETLKQKNSDYSVIFEDDAIFSKDFEKNFNDIINTNLDFNILYIGGRFEENYKMINCKSVTDKIVKTDDKKPWYGRDCDRTTHAYIISKKCCQLLLDNYNESLKNNVKISPPVDHWILNVLRKNKKDIHHSYPLLCHVPIISDSDIR